MPDTDNLSPPSRRLLMREPRGLLDIPALLMAAPFLARAPRGDKHAVMVLPGFSADDQSTAAIRQFLRYLNYDVHGWAQGRNIKGSGEYDKALSQRLQKLFERRNAPVSLIGWSRGGILARELARNHPDLVRLVITLGSPFQNPLANNVGAIWRWFNGGETPLVMTNTAQLNEEQRLRLERMRQPLPMPATAIYTRADGVVAWRSCLEADSDITENVEVRTTHTGLGFHAPALWVIADRLARPADSWRPFRAPALLRSFYPRAH
ncbi:MAG: alpha/beta hydrolase [Pseudomonadota bacterium]